MTRSMTKVLTPEEYAARHKQAFRVAFDFLNAHFPPEPDSTWWTRLSEECCEVYNAHPDNMLLVQLLAGILCYLEEESKLRGKAKYEIDDQ